MANLLSTEGSKKSQVQILSGPLTKKMLSLSLNIISLLDLRYKILDVIQDNFVISLELAKKREIKSFLTISWEKFKIKKLKN